jgi:hypothetical protein
MPLGSHENTEWNGGVKMQGFACAGWSDIKRAARRDL